MQNSFVIENERVYFTLPYNASFIADVKEIQGRKYNPNLKQWDCPLNLITSSQVTDIISKYNLVNNSLQDASIASGKILPDDLETSLKRLIPYYKQKIEAMDLLIKPREYQLHGISYMLTSRRCINGSDMGTGKTFTSIFAVEVENLFPCLVVVPASVKYNWEMQWKRVNPSRSVSVINDANSNFNADVMIVTYDSLGKKVKDDKGVEKIILKYQQFLNVKLMSVICDESQNVKSSKTLRSAALKIILKNVNFRFMLTGTSIMNRPSEIINPLSLLGQFEPVFGNWRNFVYRYCKATQTRYGIDISGAANTLELNDNLRKACYFRVEKRDVLKDLPDRQETLLSVDITNRKEYNKAQNDLIAYLKENFGQLKADNAMMAEQLVMISTLSQLASAGKVEAICDWIDNFLESSDKKLVVFGIHKRELELLSTKYKCPVITGEVDSKKRQNIVDSFQKDNNRMLFMNIMTGSVGIDGLQNICSDMLIYEFPWRWTDIEQAISRLERDGQKNSINIYMVSAQDTIDVDMMEMLMAKKQVTDAVNMGKEVDTQKFLQQMMSRYLN